jgi:hypothetical protein
MNFKVRLFGIAILGCLYFLPTPSLANTCSTTTLNNLLGTTCSIGDVSFAFTPKSDDAFSGVSASSIVFTPDASNALDPAFFLSGPLSVAASGVGATSEKFFTFFWTPTVLDPAFQISGATALLVNPVVPQAPSFGLIIGGNNLGFTNAIIQTGGPNVNPSTAVITPVDLLSAPDAYIADIFVGDDTGNGAMASVGAMEHQYNLTAVPEPPSLLLLATSLLCMAGLKTWKLFV